MSETGVGGGRHASRPPRSGGAARWRRGGRRRFRRRPGSSIATATTGNLTTFSFFEIRPGETVYANKRDAVFLRIGDEKRRLSYTHRQELLYDRGQGSFEGRANTDTSFGDVDEAVALDYASALKHPDFRRLFVARGLATGEHLTAAGALLFGREPQRFYPEAFVRVLRYRGSERGTGARQQLVYDEHFEGPIARQLIAARQAIRSEQPKRRALTREGTFETLPLVPEDAWLEGLVNATIHRSYSLAGDHIRIEIFSDRIEITSPGRFPGLLDPANPLGAPRYARNPRIARVCADQSFGQELGEGIRRMFDEMRLAGLADPLYEQSAASVKLTLVAEPVDRRLEERLPRDARALMAALRNAGSLSTGELAEHVQVSRVTAAKQLKMLRENGLVIWHGKSPKDPRASWALAPTDSY